MASFSLKPTSPPWSRPLPVWACAALGVLALASLSVDFAGVPALHGDEAWVGLRAHQLAHGGAWSWFGMRDHAGPLHTLLVAASFVVFGPSVWALRVVGLCANALAVALYAWVTGQLFGRRTAVCASLLLATAPTFSIAARTATEHAALGALLACAAVACLLVGRRKPGLDAARRGGVTRRTSALAAGALLGLGTWNHLVFVAVPLTLAGFAWARWGQAALRRPEVLWTAFGWTCVEGGPLTHLGTRLKLHGGHGGALQRLVELPALLGQVWQGDVVALRVVGRVAAGQLPWAQAALVLGGCSLLAAALDVGGRARRARLVLGAAVSLAACTAVVVPAQAERYLLLSVLVLPWVVSEGLGAAGGVLGPRGRPFATVACLVLAACQMAFAYGNVLQPLRARGAVATSYRFGPETLTSAHALDTQALYGALIERGIQRVAAHHFIAAPLRFYDLLHGRLVVDELPPHEDALADSLLRPAPGAAEVPLLTYHDEWLTLQRTVRRAEASQGLQRPVAEVADLGAFALVRRGGAQPDEERP